LNTGTWLKPHSLILTEEWISDYNYKQPDESLGGLSPYMYESVNQQELNPNIESQWKGAA
jgi:hypothetical protein